MSTRSPILGYNHNFKHRGLIFHVQTEDSGVSNPHLFTHLFHGGVILSSRKLDYDPLSEEDVVKALMQSQHKAVLKDLKQGTFDDKIDEYLGDHKDLGPRKTGRIETEDLEEDEAAPVSPAPLSSDRTERVQHPDFGDAVPQVAHAEVDATIPVEQVHMNMPPPMPPPRPKVGGKPGVATVFGQGPGSGRPRIPTPIAVPIDEAGTLGEPLVTFADSQAVPKHIVGENSGTYSQVRRKAPPEKRPRAKTQSAISPGKPASNIAKRPVGKSANPKPGMPRSSVVVSRPAVIIGAPKVVGGKPAAEATRQQVRRARPDAGLFGNDLISEKSLDEVILAYLSEDGSEE